jgi:alcohol dehydrogenase
MIASALGARVIAVDPSPTARERAAELGAEATAAGGVVRIGEQSGGAGVVRIGEQSGGGEVVRIGEQSGGAHVTIDAVGSAGTADAAVRSLRRQGRHVQVGLMLGADSRASLPWDLVVARELEILGSHGMAAAGYPAMLDMVADGRLRPDRLIGAVIPLAEAGAALAAMDEPVARHAGITVAVR